MKKTHQPPKTTALVPKTTAPGHNPINKRIRGYDEITPFLHEVDKIVIEERAKHVNHENTQLTLYNTWE